MRRTALSLLLLASTTVPVLAEPGPVTSPSQTAPAPAPAKPAPTTPAPAPAKAAPATPAPSAPANPVSPAASAPASAKASPATPAAALGPAKPGDALALDAFAGTAKVTWLYNAPSANDAAGRVVVHWFCTPKVAACTDDLARIVTLREGGGVYVVGYINGSARDAKKVDPIRESEGVGRGTVAVGPNVKKVFKQLGIAKGPAAIVVGVDGKVQILATSGDINELDSRDNVIKSLVEAVKPFTTANSAPKVAKAGEKLTFTFTVALANWLTWSTKTPMEFTFQAAKEVKCDATKLTGDQLKIADKTLTATVTCTAPKGSYQARGEIRFGYDSPNGANGLGNDGASWKFEVTP